MIDDVHLSTDLSLKTSFNQHISDATPLPFYRCNHLGGTKRASISVPMNREMLVHNPEEKIRSTRSINASNSLETVGLSTRSRSEYWSPVPFEEWWEETTALYRHPLFIEYERHPRSSTETYPECFDLPSCIETSFSLGLGPFSVVRTSSNIASLVRLYSGTPIVVDSSIGTHRGSVRWAARRWTTQRDIQRWQRRILSRSLD